MSERKHSPTSPPSHLAGSSVSAEILGGDVTKQRKPEPTTVVIFGATGDLAGRKLAPALFNLLLDGLLPDPTLIVGVARNEMSAAQFAQHLQPRVQEFSRRKPEPAAWDKFAG